MNFIYRFCFFLFAVSVSGQTVLYKDSLYEYRGSPTKIDTFKLINSSWSADGEGVDGVSYVKKQGIWSPVYRVRSEMKMSQSQIDRYTETWDEAKRAWLPQSKSTLADSKTTNYVWDQDKQAWKIQTAGYLSFAPDSSVSTEIYWTADLLADTLIPQRRTVKTYTGSPYEPLTETNFVWEASLAIWDKSYCEYSYTKGYKTESVCYQSLDTVNGKLIAKLRTTERKDTLGNTLYLETTKWDNVLSRWVGIKKEEKSADSLNSYTTYDWDTALLEWIPVSLSQIYSKKTISGGDQSYSAAFLWEKASKKWIGIEKTEGVYNARANVLLRTIAQWDTLNSNWKEVSRVENTYDPTGRYPTSEKETGYWTKNIQHVLTFDARGNLLVDSIETGTLPEKRKIERTYTSTDNISTETYYEWYPYPLYRWVPMSQKNLTYNGLDGLTEELWLRWDVDRRKWTNSERTEYTFDAVSALNTRSTYKWNDALGVWKKDTKLATISIDAQKYFRQTSVGTDSTQEWVVTQSSVSEYNEQKQITYSLSQTYDITRNLLITPYRAIFVYGQGGKTTHFESYAWDTEKVRPFLSYAFDAYYSSHTIVASIRQTRVQNDLQVYPNPASGLLHVNSVSVMEYHIFDITGNEVLCHKQESPTVDIDISSLQPGTYLLRLIKEDKSAVVKPFICF